MAVQRKRQQKELEIVPDKFGLKKIQFKGGGQLPNMLKGSFVSQGEAQNRIDIYLKVR